MVHNKTIIYNSIPYSPKFWVPLLPVTLNIYGAYENVRQAYGHVLHFFMIEGKRISFHIQCYHFRSTSKMFTVIVSRNKRIFAVVNRAFIL